MSRKHTGVNVNTTRDSRVVCAFDVYVNTASMTARDAGLLFP